MRRAMRKWYTLFSGFIKDPHVVYFSIALIALQTWQNYGNISRHNGCRPTQSWWCGTLHRDAIAWTVIPLRRWQKSSDALYFEKSPVTPLRTQRSIVTNDAAQNYTEEQQLKLQDVHIEKAEMDFADLVSKDIPVDTLVFRNMLRQSDEIIFANFSYFRQWIAQSGLRIRKHKFVRRT